MKYIKLYNYITDYNSDFKNGNTTIPSAVLIDNNTARRDDDVLERDTSVLSNTTNPQLFNVLKTTGWFGKFGNDISLKEVSKVTSDEFNDFNQTNPGNISVKWSGVTNFDEFKYFTSVTKLDASKKDSNGYRCGGFNGASTITSVTLPDSIVSIGEFAFNGAAKGVSNSNLIEINNVKNVRELGIYAFQGCIKLKKLDLTDNITSLPRAVFNQCWELESVGNMSNVSDIATAAFSDCWSLTGVNLTNKITVLNGTTFNKCYKIKDVGDLSKVTSVGSFDFYGTKELKSVNLSNKCTSISYQAFQESGVETIGDVSNVTSIGSWAFLDATNLKSLNLTENFTSLSEGAFNNCTSLTRVGDMSNVTSIKNDTFWNCSKLKEINISNKCTSIGSNSFMYCYELKEIGDLSGVKTLSDSSFAYDYKITGRIDLSSVVGKVGDDGKTDNPNTGGFTFCGVDMNELILGNKITNIPWQSFAGYWFDLNNNSHHIVNHLKNVTLPSSLKTIKSDAFEGRMGLSIDVSKGSTLEKVGKAIYSGNTLVLVEPDIVDLEVREGTTTINDNLTEGCYYLSSVTLPSTVTQIKAQAFDLEINGYENASDNTVEWENPDGSIASSFTRTYPIYITCNAVTPPTLGDNETLSNGGDINNIGAIYVPKESLQTYKSANIWKKFANKITVEYEEINYLIGTQSTNSNGSWINTGINANKGIKIEAKWSTRNISNFVIYGQTDNTPASIRLFASCALYIAHGEGRKENTNDLKVNVDYVTVHTRSGITFNDVAYVTSSGNTYGDGQILLMHDDFSAGYWFNGNFYYCKIWDGNTLVRDYIPVKRTVDGVYGLLDKVENKFYRSITGIDFGGA